MLKGNSESDSLRIQVFENVIVKIKLQLLSIIARIFDHLSVLKSSTVILQDFLQDAWNAKLNLEDTLPSNILETD